MGSDSETETYDNDQDKTYILDQNSRIDFEDATLEYYVAIQDYVKATGFQIGAKMTFNDLLEFVRKRE